MPYESVITGYPPNLSGVLDGRRRVDEWSCARDAVDGVVHRRRSHRTSTISHAQGWASTITPVAFPFHRNTGGAAAFNMGGRYEGMINLSEEEGYALSVPVSGSYDLQSMGVVWRENPTWEPRPLDDIPF